ncbi:MAG: protein kinase [Gemmatimonadales bacterium]
MIDILDRLQKALGENYAFERELGRGGMATVYLARDLKHDREVAVKVLHPELAASIGADRFEREIRLAAKLQHPHILGLYDSGERESLFYYVMPFVKGESLRDRLDREGQLPIDDAIQIALEVAGALGHAHEAGIVHRDIKPENVLLSGGHALVADFGIARAASEGGGQKLTQTGMALGTPVYMAPEQAAGETVGPTADLYSLGCMLYEMLAGEPPFTAPNAMAIMAKHAMENVPSVKIVRPTVPDEIEDAIFAAMAKVPADRPQSAAEFAEILGLPMGSTATRRAALRHTASRRVPTMAMPAVSSPRPLWKRPLTWVATAAIAVVAGVGAWLVARPGTGAAIPAGGGGLDPRDLAVLYFEDGSRDGSLDYLASGLTEALISSLSGSRELRVVSRRGVEPYRGTDIAPDSIARALGVGTVVDGSVEMAGQQIRVSIRLLDGLSGATIAREVITRPNQDLLTVRDSVGLAAETLIRRRLGSEVRSRRASASTSDNEAWSLLLRGEQIRKTADAAMRSDTTGRWRDLYASADSTLRAAAARDPRWAEPVAARAELAYLGARQDRRDPRRFGEWIARGRAIADTAVALGPSEASGFEVRGNLRYFAWLMRLEPDPIKADSLLLSAEADLVRATDLDPLAAGAWSTLSHLYYQTGSLVNVNLAARRAYEADAYLDNADLVLFRLFLSSYDLDQPADAARWCEDFRRRFPDDPQAPRCALYLMTMRSSDIDPVVDSAWRLSDSVAALAPDDSARILTAKMLVGEVIARAYAADSFANRGLADSARAVIRRYVERPSVDPRRDLYQYAAFILTTLGDKAGAVEQLKVYLAANEHRRRPFASDPGWWFRPLVDDPGFRRLVGERP